MESTTETGARGRRSPASGRAAMREDEGMDREAQYDLLTAALLGVAVGAGAALLLSAGLNRPKPHPMRVAIDRGRKWAGRRRGRMRGVSPAAVRNQIGEYLEAARDTVADTVESELKDLRRQVRRQRKRLGI